MKTEEYNIRWVQGVQLYEMMISVEINENLSHTSMALSYFFNTPTKHNYNLKTADSIFILLTVNNNSSSSHASETTVTTSNKLVVYSICNIPVL